MDRGIRGGGGALIGERNREKKGRGRGERDSKVKKKWCWR